MQRHLLTGVSLVALVAVAGPVSAATPVPFYDWTGWYGGANFGYSWGKSSSTYSEPAFGAFGLPTSFPTTEALNGPIGGGQIGYNWQANAQWVFGIEADLQASAENGISAQAKNYNVCIDCEFATIATLHQTHSTDILWFGTVRGRAGVLINPTTWLYATGGLAYGGIKVSGTFADSGCTPTCVWSYGTTTSRVGWVSGFGVEGAIPTAPNWSWKAEYLYIDFGTFRGGGFDTDFGGPFTWATTVTDQILRIGVNYHFH